MGSLLPSGRFTLPPKLVKVLQPTAMFFFIVQDFGLQGRVCEMGVKNHFDSHIAGGVQIGRESVIGNLQAVCRKKFGWWRRGLGYGCRERAA